VLNPAYWAECVASSILRLRPSNVALLVLEPPNGEHWIHEIEFGGGVALCARREPVLISSMLFQEEIVRLETHIQHFSGLLDEGGEIGKKLDFLLQEMNREANTLLSKTSGLAGEALKITEAGLAMKSEIEKSREQVQNLE